MGAFHWYDWFFISLGVFIGILYQIAKHTESRRYFRYVAGHPNIKPSFDGKVEIKKGMQPGTLIISTQTVPVKKVDWIPREKWVKTKETRGSSGLGEALIGGALAGPAGMVVGAVVGKRQAQVIGEMKDDSYSIIHSQYEDMPIQIYFQCNAAQHNRLLSLINLESEDKKKPLRLASNRKSK